MAYTTIARVRSECGFDGNTNITDALITTYLNQAHGVVNGIVAGVYNISSLAGALFTGSQAEAYLQRAEELIASGFLLIKEYGTSDTTNGAEGLRKYEEGKALLAMLSANPPVHLLDINGAQMTGSNISSSPIFNDTDSESVFSTSDTY